MDLTLDDKEMHNEKSHGPHSQRHTNLNKNQTTKQTRHNQKRLNMKSIQWRKEEVINYNSGTPASKQIMTPFP